MKKWNKGFDVKVIVRAKDEGRSTKLYIETPINQKPLTLKQKAHVLTSGLSLIIRSINLDDSTDLKDFDLMKMVINHLEMEFTCPKSFDDINYKK